ncbi:MAG: 4-hydroxy-3-methylbut-2-enyl diphosphate reductase [Acidimicrobiales bacterium]|nr:4-hydroxy-3-methylbut-2-enyl diphosphate reductase [Acidimicrobiales bacterium]
MAKGAPTARVVRTGAGPVRARRAAQALLSSGPVCSGTGPAALAVAGLAGGLREGLAPGTVVVADQVLGADGTVVAMIESAPMVASELRRRGLPVTIGAVVSTQDLVTSGARRAELAGLGAVAVDCETAYLLSPGWPVPTAVVRVVVDTPERELRSFATIPGGIKALRNLRAAAPVLEDWGRSAGARRVMLAGPRSFCAGVERAIATVEKALERFQAPVYVRRQIVHNRHVVRDLEARGAVFVQELDQVPDGATVVYSAHGVAPAVRSEAAERGLRVVDATCPLVNKVHHEVRRFAEHGFQVVLIGHAGHDETEGTLGEAEGIQLVSTPSDVDRLDIRDPSKVAYITQTTLSPSDVAAVVARLSERYPEVVGPHSADICYATQNRQDAVSAMAAECDLVIVVGSSNSSNAARLVEVSERAGARRAVLVEDHSGLRLSWFHRASTVGVTAAASTPPRLVDEVVAAVRGMGPVAIEERTVAAENVSFPLPVEVR